jgi:hypothetical protein
MIIGDTILYYMGRIFFSSRCCPWWEAVVSRPDHGHLGPCPSLGRDVDLFDHDNPVLRRDDRHQQLPRQDARLLSLPLPYMRRVLILAAPSECFLLLVTIN